MTNVTADGYNGWKISLSSSLVLNVIFSSVQYSVANLFGAIKLKEFSETL